jgi:hypothetical protein
MVKWFSRVFLFLSIISCSEPVNKAVDLQKVKGNYSGTLQFEDGTTFDMSLSLKANGFYILNIAEQAVSTRNYEDKGVFLLKGSEIELARSKPNFRFFKWSEKQVFVYNIDHKPYTDLADSSFYLKQH